MNNARSIVDEEGFVPCRDDRCSDQEIHPAHDLEAKRNRPMLCPLCGERLITMPKKRARCVNCQWRGLRIEAQLGTKNA
jgi:DNA-directed RNA polymerase subunit RPC12/RpoP